MIVNITKDHISRGVAKDKIHNNYHNPIDIAIQEMDGDDYATVTPSRVHRRCEHEAPLHGNPLRGKDVPHILCKKPFCGVYMLPHHVQQWLVDYNAGRYAPPIQFTL